MGDARRRPREGHRVPDKHLGRGRARGRDDDRPTSARADGTGNALRQLQTPTLALFGELDNNILPEKNKAAWEAALKAGGHRDYGG